MTRLHAQPYDTHASGFFFSSVEEYQAKAQACLNDFGYMVEEFEIQFIEGDELDAQLFKALDIHQGNFPLFFEKVETWDDDDKIRVILAVGQCGYTFDLASDNPGDFDLDLYELDSLRELADHFVEEGLFGTIPENLAFYLNYDAIARDLGMDYSETSIAGRRFVYRCM